MPDTADSTGTSPAGAGRLPVGERLRAAREARNLSLADVAGQTKVPARLLDAIERGAIEELANGPYAVGFAKAYARAVGIDENAAADDMRVLRANSPSGAETTFSPYEPADMRRIPPRALGWTAAAVVVALIIAFAVWRMMIVTPDAAPAPEGSSAETPVASTAAVAAPASVPAAIAPDSEVTVHASSEVWFGLDDPAKGNRPFERTLKAGETYALTPEQRGFTLRTGRPQALRIMLGTREVPQLGPDDILVKGIALDAASLAARIGERAGSTAGTAANAVAPTAASGNR